MLGGRHVVFVLAEQVDEEEEVCPHVVVVLDMMFKPLKVLETDVHQILSRCFKLFFETEVGTHHHPIYNLKNCFPLS